MWDARLNSRMVVQFDPTCTDTPPFTQPAGTTQSSCDQYEETMIRSQGARANSSGKVAESMIDAMLLRLGYTPIRQRTVGIGIYDTPIQADILIESAPGFPNGLIIESKWQGSGGSVDEKYPYLVENIRQCYPCPVIVLADGDGARPGAIRWLKSQIDGTNLYAVFTLKELVRWCNQNL
jgi:hypothetical protein